jgi:hypothetical protein
MRRRKRFAAAPQKLFRGREMTRLISMLAMLVVLGLMINRASDPALWRWLVDDEGGHSARDNAAAADTVQPDSLAPEALAVATTVKTTAKKVAAAPVETIIPGPTDLDPEEREIALEHFQAITDKQPLVAEEMPTYWRFMRWSRASSFRELQKRARRDLMFTHLWQEPEIHRGELVELRLHVRRVLSWDAPENSAGVKKIYEAWGNTDESKSFPYVLVFSELPPNLPLGDDLLEEAVFVGYFMKNLPYTAYDVNRSAPMLIGRLEWRVNTGRQALQEAKKTNELGFWQTSIVVAAALLMLGFGWFSWRSRKRPDAPSHADEAKVNGWIENLDDSDAGSHPTENAPLRPTDSPPDTQPDHQPGTRRATTRRPLRDDPSWQQPDPFDFGE